MICVARVARKIADVFFNQMKLPTPAALPRYSSSPTGI